MLRTLIAVTQQSTPFLCVSGDGEHSKLSAASRRGRKVEVRSTHVGIDGNRWNLAEIGLIF